MSYTVVQYEAGNWKLFDNNRIYGCGGKGMIVHGFKNRDEAVKFIRERQEAETVREAPDG